MAIILQGLNQSDPSILLDRIAIEENYFDLRSSYNQHESIGVNFPYGRKEDYDINDAIAVLVTNSLHLESSVMEVFLQPGKKRLGYVFSYNSAGSDNHSFSECPHFRKAVYAGVYHCLCELIANPNFEIKIQKTSGCINFSQILEGDLAILAIHLPYLSALSVGIEQLFCDLSRYGYLKAERTPFESPIFGRFIKENFRLALADEKLKIQCLQAPLCSDQIITSFIGKNFIYPADPVLRFFYHYQILERLMDMEMKSMVKNIVESTLSKSINLIEAYETQEMISNAFSGKKKMTSIVATKSGFSNPDSLIAFRAFLTECAVSAPDIYVDCLYKVRNIITHCWWSASPNAQNRLGEVVACFENDLMEILLRYSEYTNNIELQTIGDYSI